MTELEHYINSYFGIVKPDELAKIVSLFKATTIKKGDYFLKSGKTCAQLSFVQSGLLRIFTRTKDKEVTQWISTKGYFVTDLSSLVFNTPARWNIQAIVDTELYTIDKKDYDNLKTIIPQWTELEKLFIARCFVIMEDRIFSHLSMTAEERYQLLFEQNRELFHLVPLQYLASMLGMTPETLSRIRKKALDSIS